MKVRRILLLILATVLLFSCSCQKQPSDSMDSSDVELLEQPEPQRMAYHLCYASRLGDDIYFVLLSSANNGESIVASEYGSEDFSTYVPCFDTVCNHKKRSQCCVKTADYGTLKRQLSAFLYNGEPSLVIFNPCDTCFSKPYSNIKINLISEDFINGSFTSDQADVLAFLEAISSVPKRGNPFVFRNYLYYTEIKNGIKTQYRVSLTGGEPERVFEEDDTVILTIINDRFYGVRYSKEEQEKLQYFRSDMNYENVELLPEILEFFEISSKDNFGFKSTVILDADAEFIYVMYDMKVWKISDADIKAEPILLSDMSGGFPVDLPAMTMDKLWYNDGTIYAVLNTEKKNRDLFNREGYKTSPTQWYEKTTFYSFNIHTGECITWDISDQNHLITEILYADEKYVYGEGIYVHNDNRSAQGLTMRLTLDTMRYEVILPDSFWEYSAETTSE